MNLLKNKILKSTGLFASVVFIIASCGPKKKPEVPDKPIKQEIVPSVQSPSFNADSAYAYIEKQVQFGPRVPNTKGHKACGDWLIDKLKNFGATMVVQEATVTAYTGANLKIRNIMARFKPESTNRVALFAHWDTRPFSDRDSGDLKKKPVPGADDGGSGVGVLLEIARNLQANPTHVGIDIVLFDAEDYGEATGAPETYCLGSQYWAKNLPVPGYYAKFGILFDMVGAKGASFGKEGWSRKYAAAVVDKVWNTAQQLGYGMYFLMKDTEPLTDDHYFVNTIAKIPTIDIINFNKDPGNSGFGSHWHTQKDDMNVIDKNVLKAVGQTAMQVIYNER